MKRLIAAVCAVLAGFLVCVSPLEAQVRQSGNVTPTHATCWTTSGTVQDCGASTSPYATTFGVVNGTGADGICVQSDKPTAAGYQRVCLGATTAGGAVITTQNFGTAPAQGLSTNINGSPAAIPTVVTPTTSSHGACFSNTTGTLIDCGFAPAPDTNLPDLKSTYGAAGNGIADDTAAFTAAYAAGGAFSVPCGTYNVTTTTITQSATKLIGFGPGCVVIRSTVNNQPVILVNQNLNDIEITGFTCDRTVTAISGAVCIDYHNTGDRSFIHNVIAQNQYNGFFLGVTGLATLQNVRSQNNYNDGILMDDTWGAGGVQWWLDQILLQENDGTDIEVHAINGTVTLGNWTNIVTFASTGNCVYAHADAAKSIDSIRMIGGFLGSNNTHCIRLDTRGGNHVFDSVHMELFGNIATGRTLQTAASHTGDCYNISANNTLVTISNPYCNQPWGNGVTTSATINEIAGGTFQNARGTQGGIYSAVSGAKVMAAGVNTSNNGGVLQQYGIFAADGNDLNIRGGRFVANAVAAYGATANPNSISYDNSDKIQSPGSIGNVIGANGGNYTTPTCATMNILLSSVSSTLCGGIAIDATGNVFIATTNLSSGSLTTGLRVSANGTVFFPQYNAGVAYVASGGGQPVSTANLTGLQLDNGTSAPTAYAGTSCTNQFPRSLNASGAATCATVANTDLANSTITIGTTSIALGASSTSLTGLTTLTGGTGTTGTQLTFQTTSGNGTTDQFAFNGGNNGGTTFATLANALLTLTNASIRLSAANAGIRMSSEAGGVAQVIDTGSTGRYLRFLNTDGTPVFQAGNTNDPTLYFDHTTIQFTNLANNVNYAKFTTTGLTVQATTAATSTTTGSGIFGGGIGVAGTIYATLANASANEIVCYASATGLMTYEPSVAACVPSAMSFKNPVGEIDPEFALARVSGLTPAIYTYKDTSRFDAQEHDGLYADQVCAIDERLCLRDDDGKVKNYDKWGTLAFLVASIKQLNVELKMLERRTR